MGQIHPYACRCWYFRIYANCTLGREHGSCVWRLGNKQSDLWPWNKWGNGPHDFCVDQCTQERVFDDFLESWPERKTDERFSWLRVAYHKKTFVGIQRVRVVHNSGIIVFRRWQKGLRTSFPRCRRSLKHNVQHAWFLKKAENVGGPQETDKEIFILSLQDNIPPIVDMNRDWTVRYGYKKPLS